MKLAHRRQFLHLAAGVAALPAMTRFAWAQPYPSRPVRIIEGFGAGSTNDILARLVGQWLSERFGRPFIIDNRSGAAGNIATEAAVKAAPDGYTLLLAGPSNTINATLYDKLNFNFVRDSASVAGLMRVPNVVAVHPTMPVTTVPEFIAYARTNPGKLNMASSGIGGVSHVSGELFKMMAGIDIVHVPYRGSPPAITDLLGGQVQVMFAALSTASEHIKAGRLRALAVTSALRSEALPDVPTVGDFLPGFEASAVYGVSAPKNTSTEIIDRLSKEINSALGDPKSKARLADLGGIALPGSPADFGKLINEETAKWSKVIRAANIKME